jgi:hypothetical protein
LNEDVSGSKGVGLSYVTGSSSICLSTSPHSFFHSFTLRTMLFSSLLVICPLLTVPAHAFFFISSWGTTNRLGLPMIDRNRNTCAVNVGGKSIQGLNVDGGCRYTVRYGDAKRWESSQVASSIGYVLYSRPRLIVSTKFNTLPPACPQKRGEYSDGFTQSEDCLFATVYTPLHVAPNANLPVFTW